MVNKTTDKWEDPVKDRPETESDNSKFGDHRDEDKQYDFCENEDTNWPGLDAILVQAQSQQPAPKTGIEANVHALKSDRRTVILSVISKVADRQINLASKAAREMLADDIDSALKRVDV